MKHVLLPALALGLVGQVVAQTVDVVPALSVNTADNQYDPYIAPSSSYIPLHHQAIYNASDFTKPVGVITQVAYRRNNYYSNSLPAGSITCTLLVGYAATPASQASTTFANNMTTMAPMTLFTGTVNWPAVPKGTGPAAFTHVIKATTPTVFTPGVHGSVCFDLVTTATTFAASTYTIDSAAPEQGERLSNPNAQSTCKFSNGNYNNSISYTTAGLNPNGGSWYVRYSSLLPNAPGLMTISGFGVNNPGPWPLPLDLTVLGAPGCSWNVGLELGVWFPIAADASGAATGPTLTIPAGLGGVSFYDHAFFLDAAANQAGLVVSWPSQWKIGSGKGGRGATIYKTADTGSSPTGSKASNEEVVIMEVTY